VCIIYACFELALKRYLANFFKGHSVVRFVNYILGEPVRVIGFPNGESES